MEGAVDASAVRVNHGNRVWRMFSSFIPVTKDLDSPLLQFLGQLVS